MKGVEKDGEWVGWGKKWEETGATRERRIGDGEEQLIVMG